MTTELSPELRAIVDRYDELMEDPVPEGNAFIRIARLYEAIERFKAAQAPIDTRWSGLAEDLRAILNKHSMDAITHTPDFVLAALIVGFIKAYQLAMSDNVKWHNPYRIGEVNSDGG